MLTTAVHQLRHAARVLALRRFGVADVEATVADMRATLEEFGAPGTDLDMLPGGQQDDPEIQAALAARRIRQTVRSAARHVPYYRYWFASHEVSPQDISLDTIALIPPTSKDTLRGAPGSFVSEAAEPVLLVPTTGTTGLPANLWLSRHELDLYAALNAISLMVNGGLRSHHVLASAVTSRSTLPAVNTARALSLIGAGFVPLGTVDPRIVLDRLATPLHVPGKKPQITHVNLFPSHLGSLTQMVERDGWSPADFGLERIFTGGEILTGALGERAAEAFGAEVLDGYGATEITPVAGTPCAQGHLHIPAEHAHIELLDPVTHAPAGPGQLATFVVTPYLSYREATVLLRYDTGDLVRTLTAPPDCEMRALPATSQVLGRSAAGAAGAITRDILEVIQAEREVPLPTRYAVTEDAAGLLLHVVAPGRSARLLARLEQRAADRQLPVRGIILADQPEDLPVPCKVRADLTEHSFELDRVAGATRARSPV
jgi:phenylacetate-coenzyme A ligase PaaK-like adenylate-forming protein